VAYQAALAQEALSAGLPAIALSDTRPKALRIEAAAVQAAHGALLLPTAGAWVAEFRSEALAYPAGRHDDQLDALARALETGLPLIRPAGLITTAREDGSRRRGLADGF
jgi:predicted phage terminase large subunit-like protein